MNPPVIDCHTHIDQRWLTHDAALLRGMLRRCDATGVEAMVVSIYTTPQGPGTDLDMLGRIFRDFDVRLAVTVGYPSPASADELQALPEHLDGSLRAAREAAKRPEVVGIGEVGLDYYWPQKEWMPGGEVHALESAEDRGAAELDKYPLLENCLRAQAEIFTRWIDLAQEFELPLVVH